MSKRPEFQIATPARSLYAELTDAARATVDGFVAKVRPMTWAERTGELERLLPGEVVPLVWQAIITAALERLPIRRIESVDAAAWLAVSLHSIWKASGFAYLRGFQSWTGAHPWWEEVMVASVHLDQIDADAASAALTRH